MTYSSEINTTHEPTDTVAVLYSGHVNRIEIIVILNFSTLSIVHTSLTLLYLDM